MQRQKISVHSREFANCFYLPGDGALGALPQSLGRLPEWVPRSVPTDRPIFPFCDSTRCPSPSFAKKCLERIRWRTQCVQWVSGRAIRSMFQTGTQITSFYPLYTFPWTYTYVYTYRFLPFSISLVASRAWRGYNLYSVVFETGTCVSSVEEDTTCIPSRSLLSSVCTCYSGSLLVGYSDLYSCLIQSSKDVEIRQAIVDIIGPVRLYWSVFWDYILETSLSQLITRDCTPVQLKNVSVAFYEITSVLWVGYLEKLLSNNMESTSVNK